MEGLIQFFRHGTDGEDVGASPLERQVVFWGCIHEGRTGTDGLVRILLYEMVV